MMELLKNKELTLNYVPGKGAWTYHLVIPGTKEIKGTWGSIKVSGTIDGYPIKDINLAPVTGKDKMISVNGEIRKAIGKTGGDKVIVTLFKTTYNHITLDSEIKDCFNDADVIKEFVALSENEKKKIIEDILSQLDEGVQEKKILFYINKLSNKK